MPSSMCRIILFQLVEKNIIIQSLHLLYTSLPVAWINLSINTQCHAIQTWRVINKMYTKHGKQVSFFPEFLPQRKLKKQNYLRNQLVFICLSLQQEPLSPDYVNKAVHSQNLNTSLYWGKYPSYRYSQIKLVWPLTLKHIECLNTEFSRLKDVLKWVN